MKFFAILSISAIVSILLSQIPWGEPDGFHGVGLPFAQVIWEDGKDHPNSYAVFMNFALVSVSIGFIYWIARAIRKLMAPKIDPGN